MAEAQEHWQRVYARGGAEQRSWYRGHLEHSLELIARVAASPAAAILDAGGGEATLVDDLLARGYAGLTVLDIAPAALAAAQKRLGAAAARVRWVAADITSVALEAGRYDVWHDRAVFHFLTDETERRAYVRQAQRAVKAGGYLIVGAFALEGPPRCSGCNVCRYDATGLEAEFSAGFVLLESSREVHLTPSGGEQPFTYGLFQRASG